MRSYAFAGDSGRAIIGGMIDQKQSQLDKFKEAARDLECDDDDQRFKERVKKLASANLEKTVRPLD